MGYALNKMACIYLVVAVSLYILDREHNRILDFCK